MSSETMRRARRVTTGVLAVIGAAAVVGGVAFAVGGSSARRPPPSLEAKLVRTARHVLVPASARATPNPVTLDQGVVSRAREHFADHCAICHGNDGKGDTSYGRNLSPRAPDLTAEATQELADGELFHYIENGIRLTGMPAFGTGTPEGQDESWELVHFIRQLPNITAAELEAMERLNPISRADLEEELAAEAFLRGEGPPAARAGVDLDHEDHP